MVLLLLVLILTCGHLYYKNSYIGKAELIRKQGYHHYFDVLYRGFVIFFCSCIIVTLFDHQLPEKLYLLLVPKSSAIENQHNLGKLLYSIIILFILCFLIAKYWPNVMQLWRFNKFISLPKKNQWIYPKNSLGYQLEKQKKEFQQSLLIHFIENNGNTIERLLAWSYSTKKPILVSMKNNKVYVGYITEAYDPTTHIEWKDFPIVPIKSGYRLAHKDEESHQIIFNKDYFQFAYQQRLNSKIMEVEKELIERKSSTQTPEKKPEKTPEEIISDAEEYLRTTDAMLDYFKDNNIFIMLPVAEITSASPYDDSLYLSMENIDDKR